MSGNDYVKLVSSIGGAAIGWALGESIASGITAPSGSFWARGELAGNILQWCGAAVGALIALFLVSRALRE